jgi:O-acetyl-ADP-ribose deacetylase (regulator of RNase III)
MIGRMNSALQAGAVTMPNIEIKNVDITTLEVDAVVNAANNSLAAGAGVNGAIHRAAGPELLTECKALNGCETGAAKITSGYQLPAKHVIHTVGPIWSGGEHDEAGLLASCYRQSIDLAEQYRLNSIAFPAISCGVYGYPIDQACEIAIRTSMERLHDCEYLDTVIFACFGEDIELALKKELGRHSL